MVGLLRALEVTGIEYALVGSVASSAFGEPRATCGLDVVARLSKPLLARLDSLLGADYYFDRDTAEAALRLGGSFNIVSMQSVTKFDFFPVEGDAFGTSQLARRRMAKVDFLTDIEVPVASPEDIVLAKLRWYDLGGRTSERQWSDILGVLRVQRGKLDWGYIEEWGPRLGVAELVSQLPRYT
jgi:hypothetical protein